MIIPVPAEIPACTELGQVHFVGIGGAGLSAIARIMVARGVSVSGSDGSGSPTLTALADLGAQVFVGHRAEQLGEADTVVVSTAIPETNPEVQRALAQGLRVWPRSAAMQSIMADAKALAVAGTHGKTTTTSLLASALLAAGADPSYTIGGDLTQTGTNAAAGRGEWFVAEADESDGAFLVYEPFGAVVTNVEADHLDFWGTEAAYQAAFARFVQRIQPDGFLVVAADDSGARALAPLGRQRGLRVITVGLEQSADLMADQVSIANGNSRCVVRRGEEELGELELQIPGRHYLLDALAALAAGLECGYGFDDLTSGMASYTGTKRRMEFKGAAAQVRVYDSYAHHPQEIAADLEAARTLVGDGRLVVAFQPHLVSRTRIFAAQMGRALSAADLAVVLDIYLAREAADPTVTSDLITQAMTTAGALRTESVASAAQLVPSLLQPGDVFLTLGAGSITELGPLVLAELCTKVKV